MKFLFLIHFVTQDTRTKCRVCAAYTRQKGISAVHTNPNSLSSGWDSLRHCALFTPERTTLRWNAVFPSVRFPTHSFKQRTHAEHGSFVWRRGWDSNPRRCYPKLISSQPRYDHFDTSPWRVFSTALLHYSIQAAQMQALICFDGQISMRWDRQIPARSQAHFSANCFSGFTGEISRLQGTRRCGTGCTILLRTRALRYRGAAAGR